MEGVAKAPMVASVEMVVLTSSDSNQRSRMGLAAPAKIWRAFSPSLPSFRKFQPICPSRIIFPSELDHGFGGVCRSIGSRNEATRSSMASYLGKLFASFLENFET